MIPMDLSGKVALVTGVGDNQSFAWFISKALQAAGAKLVFACHPRMVGIVENFLENSKEDDVQSRVLPYRGRQPDGRQGLCLRRRLRQHGVRGRKDRKATAAGTSMATSPSRA